MSKQTVVVLGASTKPERYANMAVRLLKEYGHRVIPVSSGHSEIEGLPAVSTLADVHEAVDTLTLYLGPARSAPLLADIIALRPKRVIFNPGTESAELERQFALQGIDCQEACTLVLLRTDQF